MFVFTRPSPIIAKLKITANAEKTASQVVKPLLDAVKTGQLNSSIEGTPISFKLSEAGFRFLTSSGKYSYTKSDAYCFCSVSK